MPPTSSLEAYLLTPNAQATPDQHDPSAAVARGVALDDVLRGAALCLLALTLVYRPISSALGYGLAEGAAFGLALLGAGVCWLAAEVLGGRVRVRFGLPGLIFTALLAAALVSSLRAENWFAGLRWCLNLGTYGLTAFLVLQMAERSRQRAFLLSSLLATAVALAAYAVWHTGVYMPALRRWMELEPGVFEAFVRAEGPLLQDLAARVRSPRAYGNFITPNQLAGFLALTFFPLAGLVAGWWRRKRAGAGGGRSWIAPALLGVGLLFTASAILLSRSKGGWIAFLFGAAVFGLLLAGGAVRLHWRRLLIGLAVLVGLFVAAHFAGLVPGPERFARSLGVRVHYWETSARIALKRPLLGVGPGSWPEWYTMLKQPEFGETQAAHNVYLELWAEAGAIGLLLFMALWVAVFMSALKGSSASTADEQAARPEGAPGRRSPMLLGGLCVGLLAFAFDYALLGTFAPPEQVPGWLASAKWLPYLVIFVCWAGAFAAAFTCMDGADISLVGCGMAAGLAAFLLHSAGEFTLRVPAIGGSGAALAALLLASCERPKPGRLRTDTAVAALAGGGVLLIVWFAVVTPRALDHALSKREAENGESQLREGAAAADAVGLGRRIMADYARACKAVPYDDETWRQCGAWLMWLGQSGLAEVPPLAPVGALRRAAELNPLHSGNWARLGTARSLAGDLDGAVEAYRRAAELHPALAFAWYSYARAAEATGRADAEATDAYRRALSLLPRQYHPRNRILDPPGELAHFWSQTTGEPVPGTVIDLAVQIASRASDVPIPREAGPREKVAALAAGLKGADRLLAQWDRYDVETRTRELWALLAPRLWEWALQEKVGGGDRGVPDAARTQETGASGGARTLNPSFTKAVLYH